MPFRGYVLLVTSLAAVVVQSQGPFSPARYRTGDVPQLPAMAVGGGEVLLELGVDRAGRVETLRPLRIAPPFTALVTDAVSGWRFAPATDVAQERRPTGERPVRTAVPSSVLVAAVFRPPAFHERTLGAAPQDAATASPGIPFPLKTRMPPYPPKAYGGGVVLLEVRVGADGSVADVAVLRSAPPFDDAAETAVRGWTFRPAQRSGAAVAAFAYVMFGFPVPVVSRPPLSVRERGCYTESGISFLTSVRP